MKKISPTLFKRLMTGASLLPLGMATKAAQAVVVSLPFTGWLPSLSDSIATAPGLLGDTAQETSTGVYRLPPDSHVSGEIRIDLDRAPADSTILDSFGIYDSTSDFVTIEYDELKLPVSIPETALAHRDVVRFELERHTSASADLFYFIDNRSGDWLDPTTGLRHVLTFNSTIWVNTNRDGVLSTDRLDQSISWAALDAVPGQQTNFSLYYRLDSHLGDNLVEHLEARFTSAEVASVGAVPIPPTVWLMGSGLVGLAGLGRRRHSMV